MEHREHIGYKLRILHNSIGKRMEAKKEKNGEGLTGMQRFLIKFLRMHEEEEICQKDLETCFSMSGATVSNMLQTMEKRGLIVRVQEKHDARRKRIVLTERARELSEAARRDVAEMEAALTRGMTEEEIRELKHYLDRMIENIGADSGTDFPENFCGKKEGTVEPEK